MIVTGSFTTTTPVAQLRTVASRPEALERVSTLSSVSATGDGVVRAVFQPVIALGRIPLAATITRVRDSNSGATLRVIGRRGVQSVDVDLELRFQPGDGSTEVVWAADVVVRGNAASVGQRVAGDIAARAIGSVLAEVAAVAAEGAQVAS